MQIKISNDTSLWARRLALYLSLGAAVILASYLAFSYFGFLHTDVDSARYMLSALVQGEAAIVALVVTLSLVAVQLATQSYSARVIEVFRRTPDLWILMGIYGIAIFYGLGVLKLIERANPQVNSLSNLEGQVAFSYYLGVFAFVALVPYILKMFEMLKPSTVINMLAEGIIKKKILDSIAEGQEKPTDKDPIQPITDIVNGSIMKYDYETVRVGLNAIGDSISQLLIKNMIKSEDEVKKISKHAMRHFYEIESLALNKDGGFTFEVSKNLKKIITTFCEQNLDNVAWEMIFHYGEMGIKAVRKNLDDETCWIAIDFGYIGEVAAKNNLPKASSQAVLHLGAIGKESAEKGLIDAASFAASSIYMVGTTGAPLENVPKESIVSLKMILNACRIEPKFESTICKVVESIGLIEKAAVEHNNLNYELFNTVELFEKIGKETSEQKLEKAASETSKSLQLIAMALPNHQLKWRVIEAQSAIGKISANMGLNATTGEVAQSIGILGKEVSDDQKLKALEFLEEIGLLSCKHGTLLCDAVLKVVLSLSMIGKTASEPNRENENVAVKAISSLGMVGKAAKQKCNSVARRVKNNEFGEFKSMIEKGGKTTEIGRRILLRLDKAISKFEK